MIVLIASRSVAHFPYFSSVAYELYQRGHIVYLGFDSKWSERCDFNPVLDFVRDGYGTAQWLVRRSDRHRDVIFASREIRTYLNYKRQKDQSPFYKKRWSKYIPRRARLLPSCLLPLFSWYEKWIPPDSKIVDHIKSLDPDVVVACPANHRFSEEIEYVKAAKSLNIPTAIINYSWDNLTTKGLYHIKPDLMFVWNEAQKQDALEIHGIPSDRIEISGAPFFDKWLEPFEVKESRSDFCNRYNLDSECPYVLYLGSSSNISQNEIMEINDVRNTGMQVLFRPHPANYRRYVWSLNLPMMKPQLIDSEDSVVDFLTAVTHSDYVFGINNSAMLDAVILKGCSTRVYSRYYDTQLGTKHFRRMMPGLNARTNSKFVDQNIYPCGHAGKYIVKTLEGKWG